MIYKIGRFMQLLGLVLLPFAISGNLAEKLTLWQSLAMSGAGVLAFSIGWVLQEFAKPK